jgi:hypothetical protein
MTNARPELANQVAAAPPPVNPEELVQHLLAAIKHMSFEDRLEAFSAVAMLVMTFMPWRQVKGEGDIGLITTGGFFSLLFAGAVLGLVYLRHSNRVQTLTPKLLSTVELVLAAVQVPITLGFIFANIDRHQTTYGSMSTYASMPDFGAILSLVANFALAAGAALVMNREKHRA